ncbi:MAG TPA: hypothetical protein VFW07_11130 [Parafilimonas sp.]|nr:hypothetical protein [Parafilimonas sp.]
MAKLTDIDYRTNRRTFLGSNLQTGKTKQRSFLKNTNDSASIKFTHDTTLCPGIVPADTIKTTWFKNKIYVWS